MKPKRIPEKEFRYIYSKVPRLCVDLIIKNEQGLVLTYRDIEPYKNMWHFPGGTVLSGEKISDAVNRIAKEETGLKVKIVKVLGVMEFFLDKPKKYHTVSVGHLVEVVGGKISGSFQAKKVEFFKKVPKGTIREQKEFISKHKLL